MLKVKVHELLNFYPVLIKLLQTDTELPFELVLKINRLFNALKPEFQEIDKIQTMVAQKYGQRQDSGEYVINDKDKFNQAINKLHNLELEVSFSPFETEDFQNTQFLSVADLQNMGPFINLDDEKIINSTIDISSVITEN